MKKKAFEYFKKSADHGLVEAKFQLGYCYVNGIGTEINKEKGFKLYDEAAGSNFQVNLIESDEVLLGEFNELGKGIGKNRVRAFEFYKKSANQEFIDAHYKLGCCYENGIGTDIDKGKAFDSYKIAAEGGKF
ncbi:unnamed protein product [Rhizophagus irregularis]|nr:unnamed protein product [Rhizophagus irregularis]